MTRAYIALGANLGDRLAALQSAIDGLAKLGDVTGVSAVFETDPVGYEDQPAFYNAVAELATTIPPVELLRGLLEIEAEHGRVRTFANAPRTLDLDLLLYDDVEMSTDELTLPHPRMHERAFVLAPLGDLAPNVTIPGISGAASELLSALDLTGIRRLVEGLRGDR